MLLLLLLLLLLLDFLLRLFQTGYYKVQGYNLLVLFLNLDLQPDDFIVQLVGLLLVRQLQVLRVRLMLPGGHEHLLLVLFLAEAHRLLHFLQFLRQKVYRSLLLFRIFLRAFLQFIHFFLVAGSHSVALFLVLALQVLKLTLSFHFLFGHHLLVKFLDFDHLLGVGVLLAVEFLGEGLLF